MASVEKPSDFAGSGASGGAGGVTFFGDALVGFTGAGGSRNVDSRASGGGVHVTVICDSMYRSSAHLARSCRSRAQRRAASTGRSCGRAGSRRPQNSGGAAAASAGARRVARRVQPPCPPLFPPCPRHAAVLREVPQARAIQAVTASRTTAVAPRSTPGSTGSGGGGEPFADGGSSGRIGRTGTVAINVATSRCCSVAGGRVAVTA